MNFRRSVLAFVVVVLAEARSGRAAPPPPPPPPDPNAQAPVSRTGKYSPYELDTIRAVEEAFGSKVDPFPHGKRVESIDYVPLDVVEKRDPLPLALNALHATTKPYVLAREMLFAVGDPYNQVIVDETARNLRGLAPLSLVILVPLKGETDGSVRVVVITKDVWSLRISWDVLVTPGGLERLLLLPGEINAGGSHQTVQARYYYQPESSTFGGRYYVPRLFGSRIYTSADVNVIVNHRSAKPEGSWASFGVGQPLFSTRTEWAWGVNGGWRHEITRRYVNAQLSTFTTPAAPNSPGMPYQWRTDLVTAEAYGTRSFGWARKLDFTLSFEYSQRRYSIVGDESQYDPVVVAEFRRTRMPMSDTRSGPYLFVHAYSNDFLRILDANTLGLQEDYRLGYDLMAKVQPVLKELGASRSYLGMYAGAQYTVAVADGFVRGLVEASADVQKDAVPDSYVSAGLQIMSPRLPFGRIVYDARYLERPSNYLNRTGQLGGESRLRGYPSSYFVGQDYALSTLELRTRSVQVWSIQLGGAAFYDAAKLTSPGTAANVYQSVGFGFRFLFPQLDRTVFRGDVGFPISPEGLPPGVSPVSFFATFDQAFGTPFVGP